MKPSAHPYSLVACVQNFEPLQTPFWRIPQGHPPLLDFLFSYFRFGVFLCRQSVAEWTGHCREVLSVLLSSVWLYLLQCSDSSVKANRLVDASWLMLSIVNDSGWRMTKWNKRSWHCRKLWYTSRACMVVQWVFLYCCRFSLCSWQS